MFKVNLYFNYKPNGYHFRVFVYILYYCFSQILMINFCCRKASVCLSEPTCKCVCHFQFVVDTHIRTTLQR